MRTRASLLVVLFYIFLWPSPAKAETEERETLNVLVSFEAGGLGIAGSANYDVIPGEWRQFPDGSHNSFSDWSSFYGVSLELNILVNFWNHPQRFWLNGVFARTGIGGNPIYNSSPYPTPTRQANNYPGEAYNFLHINPGMYFYVTVGINILSGLSTFFLTLEAGYLAMQLVLRRGYDMWGHNSTINITSMGLNHGGMIALGGFVRTPGRVSLVPLGVRLVVFFTEDTVGLTLNSVIGINFSRRRNRENEENTSMPTDT